MMKKDVKGYMKLGMEMKEHNPQEVKYVLEKEEKEKKYNRKY